MTSSLQIPAEFSSEKMKSMNKWQSFIHIVYCISFFFIVVFVLPIVVK